MAAQGTALLDFGAFPGSFETSITVTGQSGIQATSLVEAWVTDSGSADHGADEHRIDPPRVIAGSIVPGVGFTVYGYARETYAYPSSAQNLGDHQKVDQTPRPYGQWSIAWVWN